MDKFRLFYEEIEQLNLSDNSFSQIVKLKTTQYNLDFTGQVLHQLVNLQFLGANFNIQTITKGIKKIIEVQTLAATQIQQNVTNEIFIKSFASFFHHIEHLSHVLRFAPPHIKKLQLALLTEVLLKHDYENHQAQITYLDTNRIVTIIQQSLQYSSDEFNYQNLIHRLMFELLHRSIRDEVESQGINAYSNWLKKFSYTIDKCLKNTHLNAQSILDGLEQFEHLGKNFLDLFEEAESLFSVNLSCNQAPTPELLATLQIKRQLLEKLRFGQERRYEYFQKICRNTINDYLSISRNLKEIYLSDNHLSDEIFVNLSRQNDLERLIEIVEQQNKESFSKPLLIGELKGIKLYNVGKLKTNLALKNFPFPNLDRKDIQVFILKIKQQFSDENLQQKALKQYLEKAQVIVYTLEGERTPEIKFAVRLNYASLMVLNFCLTHYRFPSEDEIAENSNLNLQCLTIRDSKNLDEAVIQNAIRAREFGRIKELNHQRASLQEKIQTLKKAQQLQHEVKYRLTPLENKIQQLKDQKHELELLIQKKRSQTNLQQKYDELSKNKNALNDLFFDMKARHDLIEVLLQSQDKKLGYLENYDKQLRQHGGIFPPDPEINYLQLKRKQQYEKTQLNQLKQIISQIEPYINSSQIYSISDKSPNLPDNLAELSEQLVANELRLNDEISQLKSFIDSVLLVEVLEPDLKLEALEQELNSQIILKEQIISILPNGCYQEFNQLEKLENQFKTLSQQLIDKRNMFAAFKVNFPAPKIIELSFSEAYEIRFRKVLELYAIHKDARLVVPNIISCLFEQLDQGQFQELKFPQNMLLFDQQLDKLFKTISELSLDNELSANLSFSIKRQQAIVNAQSSTQNISKIEQYLTCLLTTSNPKTLEQIQETLQDLFISAYHPDFLNQLDIENVSSNKIKQDIQAMLDNLFRIAQAVCMGKSFISTDEENDYIQAILSVASHYYLEKQLNPNQYLPDFESLGFKLKHSQKMQYVRFYDDQQKSVISIPLELKKTLPYSLRKFPKSAYFLSYGGSRGVIYQGLHANKRLMTNNRLIGHGQYGSVFQASDLFSLTELAFKQVVTSSLSQDIFDPDMQTKPSLRAIYARQDNLNQDEEVIHYAYNQAIGIRAPHYPIIEDLKPSLYIQDAVAKKISGAQNLALGNSLADLSTPLRQNLSKDMEAFHNPCLRAEFNLLEQLTTVIAQAKAILTTIEKYHKLGFTHGDIKPENIMLYKKPGSRYEACLIDKATSAFQRPYLGNEQDLLVIFKTIFSEKTIKYQEIDGIESHDGHYVKQQNNQIVFGKKALLQITFGSRNCTLPYIAPCMIDDPKSQAFNVMTYDNQSMDNWAATVLLFGVCHTKTYFNLVEGRIATDYRVPNILKVIGTTPQDLALEIESMALFNKYFACENSESVMFIPSNHREGEPFHLYRYLNKMSDELDKKPKNSQISKTQREIQDILHSVYLSIENGQGLSIEQLKNLLFQIERTKETYEKLIHSQSIDEPINHEQQFTKAVLIAWSNEPNALRVAVDEQHCVLDILCLYAKTPEQILQTQQLLEVNQEKLIHMFIGPHAICHELLQQCIEIHQQDIVLTIIEKIKSHPNYPKLIENNQLLRQAAQENLTKVFLAINQAIPKSRPTPYVHWNKSCLEFAIDNHNPVILTNILSKIHYDKQTVLIALRRCALNDNLEFYQQILDHYNQQPGHHICFQDILNFHPISAYHLWIMSSKNWLIIDTLNPENLNQFLTSPENPALIAGQFGNLAALLYIIKSKKSHLTHAQWQSLICNRDLENKSVFYHALEKKEKTSDIIELFTYIQKSFGEQQIIELLLDEPKPQDFQTDIIKSLLFQTKAMPLQQMAIIICATPWLMQQTTIAQDILEDINFLSPQTLLESLTYLSLLEGEKAHFFKKILQKYLPKYTSLVLVPNFEISYLLHPKLKTFIDDSLINKIESFQHQYQLTQCKQILPVIGNQLETQDQLLFHYIEQLISQFQLCQQPITPKNHINQETVKRLNLFCQLYASPTPPPNFTQDFLDIFDTQELKRLLKMQNPQDLQIISEQFGPIVKMLLKSPLSASDKLLAFEQIQHLKEDLQSHLYQIKLTILEKQLGHFKLNLNEICEAISQKINHLNSRKHFKAAHKLQVLYKNLSHEKNQVVNEALFNRCSSYFQNALADEELKTHRHWLIAWIYKLLGLNKPTKTIELLHVLHKKFEDNHTTFAMSYTA